MAQELWIWYLYHRATTTAAALSAAAWDTWLHATRRPQLFTDPFQIAYAETPEPNVSGVEKITVLNK